MAKCLCMEISTSTVRVAEVQKQGSTVKVLKAIMFDTPNDAVKDGKVRVSTEIVSTIKKELDDNGMTAKDVYFVVESTRIPFKQVELPLLKPKMIQNTLDLSFSDLFTVDATAYHLAYSPDKKVYEKNGQKMMTVDVYAIPNDLSESYYNLSVALGLNAKGLSSANRGAVSLFPETFKNRNVVMINLNENFSTFTVALDGNIILNKTIQAGVSEALQYIVSSPMSMDNLPFTKAAEFLYAQNILLKQVPEGVVDADDEKEALRYNTTMSIVTLIRTIEANLVQSLPKDKLQLDEIYICGLGAGFAGVSQLLANEFERPVIVTQQGENLKIHKNAADEILLLSFYPCIGSVLDGINFFTPEEQAGGELAQKKQNERTVFLIGALICLASFGYSSYSLITTKTELQEVADENTRLMNHVQELKNLGVEIAYNNYSTAVSYNEQVLNLYEETGTGNEDMTTFLTELEHILPVTARVTAITMTPSSANVTFQCSDKFVAAGVLHLLRNMDTTHQMECSGVAETATEGEVSFNATFYLKSTLDRGDNSSQTQNQGSIESENNNSETNMDNENSNSGQNNSEDSTNSDKTTDVEQDKGNNDNVDSETDEGGAY